MLKIGSALRHSLAATRPCGPMAMPGTSQLQNAREVDVPNTAGPLYVPWLTISALASETGQAVRQTFSDTGIGTGGHVQQGVQYHVSPSEHSDHSLKTHETLLDSMQANWKGDSLPQLQDPLLAHTDKDTCELCCYNTLEIKLMLQIVADIYVQPNRNMRQANSANTAH